MTAEPEYGYTEAAELLGVKESWLRDNTPRRFPHRKFANGRGRGTVMFSAAHIEEIRALFEIRPAAAPAQSMRPVGRRKSA